MRFGIIANRKRVGADNVVKRVITWIDQNDHEYRVSEALRDLAPDPANVMQRGQLAPWSEMLISMGGDGTLLASAREIADLGTPILGVNLGSLGFLTQISADEVESRLQDVAVGNHKIEERMLLEAGVNDDLADTRYFALNDVVVDRGSLARLIQLDLYVNDEFISTYRADGLIISTPTGSTAYNSAVGGPILNPLMQAIVSSPIAPQSLAARPLLFDGNDVVRIRVTSPAHNSLLTIDGQISVNLRNGAEVTIRRAPHATQLVTFAHSSFYQILRTKLHWAVLPRTEH